jgi:hypothetical protein
LSIIETQSQTLDIRDAMYNIVTADAFFAGYTFRKTKMLPVQTDLIPYLGVYIVDETMVPDGDANAGCIRFNHTSRIGFSVVQANNNPVALEKGIDAAHLKIMSLLWTDIKLMNVLINNNPEGVGIEGVVRGSRRHIFGSTGLNNETPFAELQYEVQCFTRSEWYPDITDMLNEIDVTVAVNNVDVSGPVQPITVKYMLDVLREARRS